MLCPSIYVNTNYGNELKGTILPARTLNRNANILFLTYFGVGNSNHVMQQGRIQDFHLGGAKGLCQHAHNERGTELTFGRGPGPT